jgi:hypothetical protein
MKPVSGEILFSYDTVVEISRQLASLHQPNLELRFTVPASQDAKPHSLLYEHKSDSGTYVWSGRERLYITAAEFIVLSP